MATPAPSGRFLLRVPPELHRRLRQRASRAGRSLNRFCRAALETAANGQPGAAMTPEAAAAETIVANFGMQVEAVVLFGSKARGDAGAWSDTDLLIVIDAEAPITRSLYRVWDETVAATAPLRALGESVNPHFAHLPGGAAGTAGGGGSLWLEVALHGAILWQRTWNVARWLGNARERMAEGAIRRRYAHGQPYWTYQEHDAQS